MSPSALTRRTTTALGKLRGELEGRAFERGAQTAPPEPPPSVATAERTPTTAEAEAEAGAASRTQASSGADQKSQTGHSGRLMLRMPQSLHAELARAAEREDVSLNQYLTNPLSASLGWRASDEPAPSSPRWLPAAIVTNIVVVVIAGLIALILLVVALQQG